MNVNFLVLSFAIILTLFPSVASSQKIYGEGADPKSKTPISEIMKDPTKYKGKTVTVGGMVVDVCKKRGCWMTLKSDAEYKTLRIKVKDGVMVFPMSARGKTATVKGVFSSRSLSKDQTIEYLRHKAKEQKREFNPAEVKKGITVYQVNAKGAIIH